MKKYRDGELVDVELNKNQLTNRAKNKIQHNFPSVYLTTEEEDALADAGIDPIPIRKDAMREEIKRRRDEHAKKPVAYNGDNFDADSRSQQRLQGAIERARTYNANNEDEWLQAWKLADNTFAEVTQTDLENIFSLVSKQMETAYTRESELNDQINAAGTLGDLNAIDITSGWP